MKITPIAMEAIGVILLYQKVNQANNICKRLIIRRGGLLIMDIHFEGEISCGPITLEYLAKNNISLGIMYRFRETVDDPELQEHFDAVLRMASDMICNTCYELNIDPAGLDYWQPGNDCIVTLYEPEVPD